MKQKNKGITLIALVITIIVLLILAAVSIATLTGENGILTKAQKAKVGNTKSQAEEEVKIAVGALQIEEAKKEIFQEEKRKLLEDELKQQQSDSTVTIEGTGFLASHRGYEVEIDDKYQVSVKEAFNAEEWDKTASSEDLFEWDEAGTTIIGYKETLARHEKIRIPSKCIAIKPNYTWLSNASTRSIISGGVKKIELPETIKEIGEYAFCEFRDLESINIPDNITSISDYAFEDTSLINVIIPENVTSIGSHAFSSCNSLVNIIIPENVISISDGAFYYCTSLTNIIIPNSVINMGAQVFGFWESNQTINCRASSQPSGWDSRWDAYYFFGEETKANIVWNYTGK